MNQHQKSPSFQKELAMVAEVATGCHHAQQAGPWDASATRSAK